MQRHASYSASRLWDQRTLWYRRHLPSPISPTALNIWMYKPYFSPRVQLTDIAGSPILTWTEQAGWHACAISGAPFRLLVDQFKAKGNFPPYSGKSHCSPNSAIQIYAISRCANPRSQGLLWAAWVWRLDLVKVPDPGPASHSLPVHPITCPPLFENASLLPYPHPPTTSWPMRLPNSAAANLPLSMSHSNTGKPAQVHWLISP